MELKNRFKSTIKAAKWVVLSFYGRYALGVLLAITGIFSEYGTLEMVFTNNELFLYTSAAGMLIITAQVLFMILYAISMFFYNKK